MKDISTTSPENALPARTPGQNAISQSARSMLSGMSLGEPTQALQSRQFEQEADRAAEAVENPYPEIPAVWNC